MMPDRYWLACGACVAFIVGSFFLAGLHHDIKWRLERRRRGGYLL